MKFIRIFDVSLERIELIKIFTSSITSIVNVDFWRTPSFFLTHRWACCIKVSSVLICVIYLSSPVRCVFVLCILIVIWTRLMAPRKTLSSIETVVMCDAVWPRNDLAHCNVGQHQKPEARSLKYSYSSRHPDCVIRHLMQVCILPGVQKGDVVGVMWLHNPVVQLIKLDFIHIIAPDNCLFRTWNDNLDAWTITNFFRTPRL